MSKNALLGLAALIALPVANASAATIEVDHRCKDNPDNCAVISIDGDIVDGDAKRFERVVKDSKAKEILVLLNSPGGKLVDAMDIGISVHENGYVTAVADKDVCASACTTIWLAGKERLAAERSHIGFHAPYIERKGKKMASKEAAEFQRAYYRRLGLTEKAIRYLLAAKPDDITWLDGETAYDIGIIVTVVPAPKEEAKTENKPRRSLQHAEQKVQVQKCNLLSPDPNALSACQ
jgi:hypothetical protein